MKLKWLFFFLLAPIIVSAQSFTSSTQSGIDLKAYNTFTVVKGDIVVGEENTIDKEAFYTKFKEATIRELSLRGYQFIDDSTAQLRVSYVLETSVRMDVVQLGPMGQMPTTNAADVSNAQSWSREFRQGSLIVMIDDAQKKITIWSAEGTVDATRARGGDLIDMAVRNAFKKFPDKTKKEKPQKKMKR